MTAGSLCSPYWATEQQLTINHLLSWAGNVSCGLWIEAHQKEHQKYSDSTQARKRGSHIVLVACLLLTPAANVWSPLCARERLIQIYFLPFNIGDCVYILWLTWLCTWWCHLTNFWVGCKEPLRMTRCWQWSPSVSHTHTHISSHMAI